MFGIKPVKKHGKIFVSGSSSKEPSEQVKNSLDFEPDVPLPHLLLVLENQYFVEQWVELSDVVFEDLDIL
jgi:hypothetical protein